MIGSDSCIDVSVANIWRAWYAFGAGKKRSVELDTFAYHLEENLIDLHDDLINGTYQHRTYRTFQITDTKRRVISVASVRDRIVHRLVYDYLVAVFDKIFIYDAWSCRSGKGLHRCIMRTQQFLYRYNCAWIVRSDIAKFFDHVDHTVLKTCIARRVRDDFSRTLIEKIIDSFSSFTAGIGMPIGNLTSQIFTNIYLHELDRLVVHVIKPHAYVRYGDDFILIGNTAKTCYIYQQHITSFLYDMLKLSLNPRNTIIVPVRHGIHFLGLDIFPTGRRLRARMHTRINQRVTLNNWSSYRALLLQHSKPKMVQLGHWQAAALLDFVYE